jgi:hypothetical protein
VSLGVGTDHLPLSERALQEAYLAESKRVGLPLASVCLEVLHKNVLKSDPLGQRWVADAIPIARALGVKVILLPFFGKGALATAAEMDYVGDALKEIAPQAEGGRPGLRTISARDNVPDHGADEVSRGADVLHGTYEGRLRRWRDPLAGRAAHLRGTPLDNPHFLGEGKDFPAVVEAPADIGFGAWRSWRRIADGSVESDMKRNLGYVRGLMSA